MQLPSHFRSQHSSLGTGFESSDMFGEQGPLKMCFRKPKTGVHQDDLLKVDAPDTVAAFDGDSTHHRFSLGCRAVAWRQAQGPTIYWLKTSVTAGAASIDADLDAAI